MPTYVKIILGLHIAAGFSVLITGILVYLLRKGNQPHRQLGWIYYWSMMGICLTGVGLITYRFNPFLLLITVLTFYLSYSGVFSFQRTKGKPGTFDLIAAGIAAGTGLWGLGYGIYAFIRVGGFQPFGLLFIFFGLLLGVSAKNDLKWYRDPEIMTGKWRIEYHIVRMGASFIAATTAFSLAGAFRFIGNWEYGWTLWIIPTLIGTPLIRYYKRNYFKRT
ncbi:MAG: hypothetical protein AAF828_08415 [Bacteroidota bacterium]